MTCVVLSKIGPKRSLSQTIFHVGGGDICNSMVCSDSFTVSLSRARF